jgi:gluconolactonase
MKNIMKSLCSLAVIGVAVLILALPRPARPQESGPITKMDPDLDRIVATDAKIEKVAGDFAFTEGPVWSREGYLLFSDIPNNVINKLTADGKVSVYLNNSGYGGSGALPVPKPFLVDGPARSPYMIGSNGLTLDRTGALIFCEHGNRRVERMDKEGKRSFVADSFAGKKLNSPNDVVVKLDGSIYFTDPPFGLIATHSTQEQPFAGVYRVRGNKIDVLIKDLEAPNGLAFSPYEKFLYVDNSSAKTYLRYEVKADGTLENGKVFYDASKDPGEGVPDGMKVDTAGNIYATGPVGLYIFAPDGKVLGKIKFPEQPANLAWGDADGKTLYVTARTSVYRIRTKIAGDRP